MATELDLSPLEDPLLDLPLPSLLPKTLGAAPGAQQLGSIDDLLKSMVGKGSTMLLQQAETITKSYSNSHSMHTEDGFAANFKDHTAGRRPALGRKRAKFSLKPEPSHVVPNIDFSSRIDHIDDPEEYFLACEQLENAEKELKKLRGEDPTDPVLSQQGTTVRKRRPGLLGKSSSYKHHTSANADPMGLVESQKHLGRRIASSSNMAIDTRASNSTHQGTIEKAGKSEDKITHSELEDAIEDEGSEKESNVNNLLENLMSSFKDLDEDEGKTLLRKSLQIKSLVAEKICLPDLGNIQVNQFSVLTKRAATHGESKSSQMSPPITNNLLKTISAIHKRDSLKDPLKDIYSVPTIDDAPSSGEYTLVKSKLRQLLSSQDSGEQDDSGFSFQDAFSEEKSTRLDFVDGGCSPVIEADVPVGRSTVTEESPKKHCCSLLEVYSNSDANGIVNEKGYLSGGYSGGPQEANNMSPGLIITEQPDGGVEGSTSECAKDNDLAGDFVTFNDGVQVEGDNTGQEFLNIDQTDAGIEALDTSFVDQTTLERLASPPNRNMSGKCRRSEAHLEMGSSGLDNISQPKANAAVHEKMSDAGTSTDIPSATEATVLAGQHLESMRSVQEESNEEHQAESGLPRNEGNKRKASQRTRKKKISSPRTTSSTPISPRQQNKQSSTSGRRSLANAGMIWENGRRKSSRRRFKPLEHWRGERLLYGRIHESLSTVIGWKFATPGKENFQVESFVSEEYADLVALAARC